MNKRILKFLSFLSLFLILFIWIISGFFISSPYNKVIILRLGKYNRVLSSGVHWIPNFFEKKYFINTQKIYEIKYGTNMLTKDENIVYISLIIQYRISDKSYIFGCKDPNKSFKEAIASTIRSIVGKMELNRLLTSGRSEMKYHILQQLIQKISLYHLGIFVEDVNLQPIKPPEEVTYAFNDAIKAREDKQRYINKSIAYSNRILNLTKGKIFHILRNAEAYEKSIIMRAKSEMNIYNVFLHAYKKYPVIVKNKLYFLYMENILKKVNKIFIDAKNIPYVMSNQYKYFFINKHHKKNTKK